MNMMKGTQDYPRGLEFVVGHEASTNLYNHLSFARSKISLILKITSKGNLTKEEVTLVASVQIDKLLNRITINNIQE
jgi:hypothetical protein